MSAEILADLAVLRRRVRGDRHAYAFPHRARQRGVETDIFYRLGWTGGWPDRVTALQNLLLPGIVLLVGGVVAVVGNRR